MIIGLQEMMTLDIMKEHMHLRTLLLSLLSIAALEAKPLSVQVSAPSAILINADTGAILYAKDIHRKSWPGSITKIATAMYVLEKKGDYLDEIVQASKKAVHVIHSSIRLAPGSKHAPYQLEHDGTMAGIKPGEAHSLHSLLYGLMLSSGNDAGNVIAEAVSGSVDRFCEELNSYLKQHGVLETQFVNPHGLHHDDHWTTAYDMAKMTRVAMKHPTFREIVKTTRYLTPQTNLQPAKYYVQHNRLLKQGALFYPKAIGVKTGYHSRAGFTMVGAATHEGRTLIAVVLKCQESSDRFRDVIKLFDAAFSEKKTARTLYARDSDTFTHRIPGATEALKAVLKDDAVLEYYPAEEPQFRAEIKWTVKDFPLSIGDCVGHLRCIDESGNVLMEKPIFAVYSVSRSVWSSLTTFCKSHKPLCLALFLGSQVLLLLVYFFKKHKKLGQG
jgi:D-alanyl-D-alanine carboxypeptidase (penicillin-binding protein 5/6)